jgi:hypothetical protein
MVRNARPDEQIKKDLTASQLRRYLRRAHLPDDYADLNPKAQLEARMATLTSWFDPESPNILVTNVKNYVAAHFLLTEYYMKPARMNQGTYFFQDPKNKYDMIEQVMGPGVNPRRPAMSVLKATRRFGKTQSFIVESMTLISLVRPYTLSLLTELNRARTGEELDKIKTQVEDNERIHSDFGGEGVLFPRKGATKKWNSSELNFLHLPETKIMGHSMKSAQRGRGPLFGVVDDPEDEDNCFSLAWRRWFFGKLLGVFVDMFHWGGKLLWIGTPVHEGSCLSQAHRGVAEKEEDGKESVVPQHDPRFDEWKKLRFSLIRRKPDKSFEAMQPERMTVADFERRMEVDPINAMKEILCEAVTPGTRAFRYDPIRHGYVHATEEGSNTEVMVDLYTGEVIPWGEFLSQVTVFGAGDLADGQSADADPGAIVFVGIRPPDTVFILDAWNKQCLAETLVERAYQIAEEHGCVRMGWERTGMLCVINRTMIKKHVEELRSNFKHPPVFIELDNAKKNKVSRILSMTPLFSQDRIRFPIFRQVKTPDGRVWNPVEHLRKGHIELLLSQVREFTEMGLSGHDDLIDTLEMAHRTWGGADVQDSSGGEPKHPTEEILDKWQEAGVAFHREQVPIEAWTPQMQQEAMQQQVMTDSLGVPCL